MSQTEAELEFEEACRILRGVIDLLLLPIVHDIYALKQISGVAHEEDIGYVEVIIKLGLVQRWTEKLKARIIRGHRNHADLFNELACLDIRHPGPLPGVGKVNSSRWKRVIDVAETRGLGENISIIREYLDAHQPPTLISTTYDARVALEQRLIRPCD